MNDVRLKNRKKGFTLIELIVVIILMGILAAYALPNLNLDGFREQGFEQQAMAAIRYAQKQAIGSGCEVIVSIAADGCTMSWNGSPPPPTLVVCPAASPISNPASGLGDFCDDSTPNSTADLTTTISFDNIGSPTATAGDLSINLGSTTITIEPETGFAHE